MSTQSAYPLQWPAGWPRTPRHKRERGTFKGTLDRVRRELLMEIDRIALGERARTHTIRNYVVLSTNIPLRKDGELSANSASRWIEDVGAAVYFERKGQQVCMACDRYDEVWKNLRAIQLSIEALRGLERWGSSQILDRAFTGFAALPARREAGMWELLGLDPQSATEDSVMAAWRSRCRECHPDMPGGSHEAMAALNEAKDNALATLKRRAA